MPQVSRLHHTVPRFYLDGFAARRQIGTVELPGDRRFIQSTRTASAENNFYTIPESPDEPDVFEKSLADLERDASRVFVQLKDKQWPLDPESRGVLATFLAVQFVRGPDHRRQLEQLMALMAQLQIGIQGRDSIQAYAERELGMSLTVREADMLWDQATRPGGPPVKLSGVRHAGQLLDSLHTVFPYFIGRPWVLIRFGRRCLITCDTPVALIGGRERGPNSGIGVGTAEAITVALSRKIGLVMVSPKDVVRQADFEQVSRGGLDSKADPTTNYAAMFNEATIRNARRWLFHHPEDFDLVPSDLHDPVEIEIASTVPDFRTAEQE